MATSSPCDRILRVALLALSLNVSSKVLCAEPTQDDAREAAQGSAVRDLVLLQNGNEFEGVITADEVDTLTMRLARGQEIEISKAVIAKVVRRTQLAEAGASIEPRAFWDQRHSWFHLRDALGHHVGKLHYHVRPNEDGGVQLEEQWTFVEEGRKSFLSRIEVLDAQRAPRSFVLREAVSRLSDDHVERERLVRGNVIGDTLHIVEAGLSGRRTRALPFPAGSSFPLAVAEAMRRGESEGAREFTAKVYDPLDAAFELRRYSIREGVAAPGSDPQRRRSLATQIESHEHGRVRREWVATDASILLVEVNGIHLVAEPVSEATANATSSYGRLKLAPRVARLGDVEVFLPRATWQLGRTIERGRCIEVLPPIDVSARVRWVATKPSDDAMLLGFGERWLTAFCIDHTKFRETSQELVSFDGEAGLRITGKQKDAVGHEIDVVHWIRERGKGYVVVTLEGDARQVALAEVEARDLVHKLCPVTPSVAAEPGR